MSQIVDVWASNLDEQMSCIAELLPRFPFIGMDTEFPGVVLKDEHSTGQIPPYPVVSANVNLLSLIQFGITLSDSEGEMPRPISTWQFNFRFDLAEEIHSPSAINMLYEHEIDFNRFKTDGIDPTEFAHYVYAAGLVQNNNLTYVTFHGVYDFAYMLKVVSCQAVPRSPSHFLTTLEQYVPHFLDLKTITTDIADIKKGGLQKLMEELDVNRIGTQHQAGSDSLDTLTCFIEISRRYLSIKKMTEKYDKRLYGVDDGNV